MPLSGYSIKPIQLPPDTLMRLGGVLTEVVRDQEQAHSRFFDNLRVWWRWYEAEPKTRIKTFPWRNAPLSRDTEILTREGWQRVDTISVGDIVLTRNDASGSLEWCPVLARPAVYAENLLHFKSKSIDQLVTDQHTMVTKRYWSDEILRSPAAERFKNPNGHRVPLAGSPFCGDKPAELFGMPAGDILELFGWYLSEGYSARLSDGRFGGCIFISQSRSANPDKCQKIEELLDRLGISWAYARDCFTLHARSMRPDLLKALREQGTCSEKHVPSFVFSLDSSLIWRLLESLFAGDGNVRQRVGDNQTVRVYHTTSKRLADGVQTLAALVGLRGTIKQRSEASIGGFGSTKPAYIVYINHRKWGKLGSTVRTVVPYNDTAYCVTVHNHAIYVRRNGTASWTGNSNVVAPVIRTQADSRTATDFALLWGTKDHFFSAKSQNEQFSRTHLGSVTDFLNWAIEAEVNPFWAILDWIHERNCIGTSVMSVSWDETERFVFAPNSKKPEKVVMRRGVRWNHHPAESILWEPGISVRDSDRVIVQYLKTTTDIAHCLSHEDAGYIKDNLLALLKKPHINGSPGAEVRAEKDERAGVDAAYRVGSRKIFDTRSLWVDWPVMGTLGVAGIDDISTLTETETGEQVRVPLIIELAPDTKSILRILPNPYLMADGNPFFDIFYKKQAGYSRGVGLCKILEGPQRAQSTVINQAIDSRTQQLAMPFKTTDPKLRERPITPGSGMYVTNMQDAEAFPIPGASPMDITLVNLLQVYAERAGGTTDPMIGRESRSGGHPSPATNYMGQLQQGAKMGSVPTLILGQRLAEIGLYTASLYQQFDTDESGRLIRVFGSADAVKIRDWLFPNDMTMVGNLQLSLTALSDDNPQAVMQRAMMVAQVTQMYFGNILKLIQVLSTPQVPAPVKKAAIQAVQVLGDTHQDFLEAASYDEAQEAILRLDQGDLSAIAKLSQLAAQAGAQGQPGEAGEGGGPGPSPNGAPQPGNGGVPQPPSGPEGGAPSGPPQSY